MTRKGIFGELLEGGSVWGWVGGYLVAAWVVLQVTETLASLVGLPLWFGKAVLGLLGLGLLVVLATAALQRKREAAVGTGASGPPRLRGMLTWRRAALLGVAGFTLLGMVAAGHIAARAFGVGPAGTLLAKGLLPEDAELVLSDFEDHAGDPGTARATTQALRVHLSQSPAFRLASEARVSEVLTRMEVERGEPLDLARAREVAIREGLKGVVGGEIHRVGSRYSVSARLVAADGTELVSVLETAEEADDLIPAVERLSLRLRERIGESLTSVRRSPPLERVRTASLAALKSYTEGSLANSRGEFERCALLMDEAIALDSAFAMAYVGRAACNQNLGRNRALQVTDRVRAYEMRERMTEEERLRFTAIYHQFVTRDRKQALDAWEAYHARYPDRPSALFALANLYAEGRDWSRAEATLLRGLEVDSSSVVVLINLAGYQTNQGRLDDAEATFQRLSAKAPNLELGWRRATLKLAAADWSGAEAELLGARDRARGDAGVRAIVATLQALLAQTLGRAEEAERWLTEALTADQNVSGELYHLTALTLAELHLTTRADTAAALRVVEQALATHTLDSLDPFERHYFAFAELLARAGRLDRARSYVAAWEREVAPLVPGSRVPHSTRAILAEAEGRLEEAIAAWRLEDEERENPLPALVHIGRVFDRLGQPDSAIDYYRRYLTTPYRLRYETDPAWRGPVLERLADLYDARGERAEAARLYALFTELWVDADPALQPRVAAARARLEALAREG